MLRTTAEKKAKGRFPVLADAAGTVSGLYGVAMQMRIHGEWSNRPATFVIDKEGVIRFEHRATAFSDRPSVEKILAVLRRIEGLPAEPEIVERAGGRRSVEDDPADSMRREQLSELAGKSRSGYTILTVFHPACPGCLTEAIALGKKRDVLERLRVPVHGLSVSGPAEALERFRKAAASRYSIDVAPWAATHFKVRFYPTLLILDRDGKEVFRAAEDTETPVDDALRFLESKIEPERAAAPESRRPPFEPVRVVKPFPPITDPPLLPAKSARKLLRDEELVLGVAVSGGSRAYPINMLTGPRREIINDVLEGTAIAATW